MDTLGAGWSWQKSCLWSKEKKTFHLLDRPELNRIVSNEPKPSIAANWDRLDTGNDPIRPLERPSEVIGQWHILSHRLTAGTVSQWRYPPGIDRGQPIHLHTSRSARVLVHDELPQASKPGIDTNTTRLPSESITTAPHQCRRNEKCLCESWYCIFVWVDSQKTCRYGFDDWLSWTIQLCESKHTIDESSSEGAYLKLCSWMGLQQYSWASVNIIFEKSKWCELTPGLGFT